MFSCKVCKEKDLRIEDLKAQIRFLHAQLQPSPTHRAVEAEMDKILEGGAMPIIDLEPKQYDAEFTDTELEFQRIIAGNYS